MLDNLDRKILQQLELDSRQSNARISRKTGANKTLVNYRIERLHRNKIITGYTYIANQVALGKLSFGLLISFKDILLEQEEELIKKFNKIEQVSWVKSIDGKWDIILVIIEKDIHSFNEVLEKIFRICGNIIKEYSFYIDYAGSISGHDYLYKDKKDISVSYSFQKDIKLKDSELNVYNLLKKEPRLSLLQVAHKLNMTYDTIKSKFNHLKKEGILLRCSPKINISALGCSEYLCLFNLAPSEEKLKQVTSFCSNHPNIVRYSRCLGQFNFTFNVHSENNNFLKKMMYDLRSKYNGIINSLEIIHLSD